MSHTVSGVTTTYTWDVAAGLPVVLQDGANTYVYGLDLISVYTDDLEHGTTAQDYYFSDGLGSTVTLARASASNETGSYTYDAFGEMRTESGTLSTSMLFTGEQRDGESDLYYLRARYYDPSIGGNHSVHHVPIVGGLACGWRFTRPRHAPPRYSPDVPTTLTDISKKGLAPS